MMLNKLRKNQDGTIANMSTGQVFKNLPVCILPWRDFGLGWNKFAACCNSYAMDWGSITDAPPSDFQAQIFNAPTYRTLREMLSKGQLLDVCQKCYLWRNANELCKAFEMPKNINQHIKDEAQKERVTQNYRRMYRAFTNGESEVEHLPSSVTVTCGSTCNIKCKFCYNCHMDYHPEPEHILPYIDALKDTLDTVTLTGGEALITKTGRAIIEEFKKGNYHFAVDLWTNAQWTDFSSVGALNLSTVHISCDAATKEVYETVRCGGDFDDLISNVKQYVKLAKERGFGVYTSFVITSDNYKDIPLAVELYHELGTNFGFTLVQRESDDPQNIQYRKDLYKDLLDRTESGLSVARSEYTSNTLKGVKQAILGMMNT